MRKIKEIWELAPHRLGCRSREKRSPYSTYRMCVCRVKYLRTERYARAPSGIFFFSLFVFLVSLPTLLSILLVQLILDGTGITGCLLASSFGVKRQVTVMLMGKSRSRQDGKYELSSRRKAETGQLVL